MSPLFFLATDSSSSPAELDYLHSRLENFAVAKTKLFKPAKVRKRTNAPQDKNYYSLEIV